MNNYKIRVNNEAESWEAQELFFELGYKHKWDGAVVKESWNKARFVYAEDKILWSGNCSDDFAECNFQELTLPQLRDLVVKHRKQTGLISGADALRALADGNQVEALVEFELGLKKWHDARDLPICDVLRNGFDFRLKPRTVKLEIEVPAPFEPKEGDSFWILSTNYDCGYIEIFVYRNDEQGKRLSQFGTWRTEAEIKIVVEQLRKIKEHSK
ncbi:hypothetical protein [Acinetobacter soli]|uniref:hypothetical protein n=1 Tax=Acinetobacter soli TaxID=487316 RepID=UPI001D0B5103|nr:hypothetical protein [Acinetobacter soli]MCB8770143.1 hypothetical protein [Acinetobacter soli]